MEQTVVKRISVSTLRDDLAKVMRKVEHEEFTYVICRHGVAVAAVVPMAAALCMWEADIVAGRKGRARDADPALPEADLDADVSGKAGEAA